MIYAVLYAAGIFSALAAADVGYAIRKYWRHSHLEKTSDILEVNTHNSVAEKDKYND
jgi:hypothetical protein